MRYEMNGRTCYTETGRGDFRTGMSGGCLSVKYLKYGILPKYVFVDPHDGGGFVKFVPERTCKNNADDGFKCSSCGYQLAAWSNFTTAPIPIKYCPNCKAKVVGD